MAPEVVFGVGVGVGVGVVAALEDVVEALEDVVATVVVGLTEEEVVIVRLDAFDEVETTELLLAGFDYTSSQYQRGMHWRKYSRLVPR